MRGHNLKRVTKLSRAALAFRAFHAAIAVEQLLATAYVWWCVLTGRRDRMLRIAVATLIGEGVLVTAKRGDCPLGGLQERFGDPVPLFELVLSPRAAKRAVPTLGAITAAGLALLVARGRRDGSRDAPRDPRAATSVAAAAMPLRTDAGKQTIVTRKEQYEGNATRTTIWANPSRVSSVAHGGTPFSSDTPGLADTGLSCTGAAVPATVRAPPSREGATTRALWPSEKPVTACRATFAPMRRTVR